MLELQGKENTAKVFTDNVNQETIGQSIKMLNEPITKNTQVRIMPDTHYGSGATVGTTIKLPDNRADWKISPAIVGTDMSCAMMSYKIAETDIDLEQLDLVVNRVVPAGARIHAQPQNPSSVRKLFKKLSYDIPDKSLHEKNLGTLGGGNHFIELAKDEDGNYWLTVHSGSRSFGKTIAQHHQGVADQKANARLPYLEGADLDAYLNDSLVAHEYAHLSRKTMLDNIVKEMNWTVTFAFDSVHNNVDIDNGIIRKGATSAQEGELLIIPLNMRDGSLICVGKGNPDWNASAPHGAGRLLSRSQAKELIDLADYQAQMDGVYSSSVGLTTLDEAPDAYKPADEIKALITDTVDIKHHIKPVYNFKAH